MNLSQEVYDAVKDVCVEFGQDEELVRMITKAIENKLDNNYTDNDLRELIQKVRLLE